MDATARIERALEAAIERAVMPGAPPKLSDAMKYAVFPGGARVRPQLCIAVAEASGGDQPLLADSAAAAIELLHCASLVHDDLPCFDNADVRRGKPSVHKAFSEPLAVLAGDALIVLAFETLAHGAALVPGRLPGLIMTLGRCAGMPMGIVAGQAWECEPKVKLSEYHKSKTGSLFAAATVAGALASGGSPDRWRLLGERIGEAYQVADDIQDMIANPDIIGKPCGRDVALHRPSATRELGLAGAARRIEQLVSEAVEAIPDCPGAGELRGLVAAQAKRFVPKDFARHAA
jgi:geranylgeranyl diphosphate synthase type II